MPSPPRPLRAFPSSDLQTNPGATPATVRTTLFNLTTKGIVTSSNTTNNHLLFTNF